MVALLWLFLVVAGAQEPSSPPVQHDTTQACAHCHTSPHQGTATAPCSTCHSPTDWLPLFTVLQHASTAFPLSGRHEDVACGQCHTGHKLTGQPLECAGCHVDRHRGLLGDACESCHSVEGFTPVTGFDHARTGFALAGGHAPLGCAACHKGEHARTLRAGQPVTCRSCHAEGHGPLGAACDTCHQAAHSDFAAARSTKVFDHRTTGFPLERRHAPQPCAACHPVAQDMPATGCHTCHADPHAGQAGVHCEDCHQADRWRMVRFDHDLSSFALRGRHFVAPCGSCHTNQRWMGLTSACWDCHADDAAAAAATVPAHEPGRTDCGDCHGEWRW